MAGVRTVSGNRSAALATGKVLRRKRQCERRKAVRSNGQRADEVMVVVVVKFGLMGNRCGWRLCCCLVLRSCQLRKNAA